MIIVQDFETVTFYVLFLYYLTALLFAQVVYFDNRSTGEAYRSFFDIINFVAMCLAEFI